MTDRRTPVHPARKRIERTLIPGPGEKSLCELVGSWPNCDVWLLAPLTVGTGLGNTSPWPTAFMRLYGRDGAARVLLQTRQPRDVPGSVYGTARAQLVLSNRGRACDAFEVTVEQNAARETPFPIADAELVMECWGSDGSVTPAHHDLIEIAMSLPTTATDAAVGNTQSSFLAMSGPAVLWRASCANLSAGVAYLGIYDQTAALVANEIPIDPGVAIPTLLSGTIVPPRGLRVRVGAMLGLSSRPDKFAAVAKGTFLADVDSLA